MNEDIENKKQNNGIVLKKEWKSIWTKRTKKEKCCILFCIGIVLFLWNIPDGIGKQQKQEGKEAARVTIQKEEIRQSDDSIIEEELLDYQKRIEGEVEELLMQMEGVGKVSVMITIESEGDIIVEKDGIYEKTEERTIDSAGGNKSTEQVKKQDTTLMYQDEEGHDIPYVKSKSTPKIEGIMVVCDGGGEITVVAKITHAMEALFGIEPHKIVVVKRNAE